MRLARCDGDVIAAYTLLYAVGRFQFIGVVMFAVAAVVLITRHRAASSAAGG